MLYNCEFCKHKTESVSVEPCDSCEIGEECGTNFEPMFPEGEKIEPTITIKEAIELIKLTEFSLNDNVYEGIQKVRIQFEKLLEK